LLGCHKSAQRRFLPDGRADVSKEGDVLQYRNKKVVDWIAAQGGLPDFDKMLILSNKEARKIWRVCPPLTSSIR
jgi:hypothetical protein